MDEGSGVGGGDEVAAGGGECGGGGKHMLSTGPTRLTECVLYSVTCEVGSCESGHSCPQKSSIRLRRLPRTPLL